LIQAFSDDSIDMILCAIGGNDTYRLLPYLFENDQLQKVIKQKIFLGFSDTTMNHLMLHKLGIKTFYGQSLLQGNAQFEGEILGGCLESLYDIFDNSLHADSTDLCQKYKLFPDLSDWEGKILLLETSEEKTNPDDFKKMLQTLKATGIFAVISGLLVGKPMDETFYDDYKEALLDIIDSNIPIVYNLNVGHATPRAIVPFGVHAHVDATEQVIRFDYNK